MGERPIGRRQASRAGSSRNSSPSFRESLEEEFRELTGAMRNEMVRDSWETRPTEPPHDRRRVVSGKSPEKVEVDRVLPNIVG